MYVRNKRGKLEYYHKHYFLAEKKELIVQTKLIIHYELSIYKTKIASKLKVDGNVKYCKVHILYGK